MDPIYLRHANDPIMQSSEFDDSVISLNRKECDEGENSWSIKSMDDEAKRQRFARIRLAWPGDTLHAIKRNRRAHAK